MFLPPGVFFCFRDCVFLFCDFSVIMHIYYCVFLLFYFVFHHLSVMAFSILVIFLLLILLVALFIFVFSHYMFNFTGGYDPKVSTFADVMKVGFMTSDILLKDEANQVHGFQIILDFSEFGTEHMFAWDRTTIQKSMRCWQV